MFYGPSKIVSSLVGWISAFFRALGWRACRYTPTCSEYAKEALSKKFFPQALGLVVWRILRCHPYSRGGYDPVRTK